MKKGSVFTFVYALFFLFVASLLLIIFTQVLTNNIYDVTNSSVFNLTSAQMTEVDRKISFWNFMPFVLIFVTVFYMIYWTANRGGNEYE